MEKYTRFRDPGTGLAPFLPVPGYTPPGPPALTLPLRVVLFAIRLPVVLAIFLVHVLVFECLLAPLWWITGPDVLGWLRWIFIRGGVMGIAGVWWVPVQVDNSGAALSSRKTFTAPLRAGDILVANQTSPLDILLLASTLCSVPLFTQSYPGTSLVEPISFPMAILRYLLKPSVKAPTSGMMELKDVTNKWQKRIVVVFPEGTATNSRGLLASTPSLSLTGVKTRIWPYTIKYTPTADLSTPITGFKASWSFFWRFLSQFKREIKLRRAAQPIIVDDEEKDGEVVEKVMDALARVGRMRRLGLGVQEKRDFLDIWGKRS
ncbi:Lysophosphatidic acid:oleoyl-CoA acyltransferase 1 [Saitoella coloradoensis]